MPSRFDELHNELNSRRAVSHVAALIVVSILVLVLLALGAYVWFGWEEGMDIPYDPRANAPIDEAGRAALLESVVAASADSVGKEEGAATLESVAVQSESSSIDKEESAALLSSVSAASEAR